MTGANRRGRSLGRPILALIVVSAMAGAPGLPAYGSGPDNEISQLIRMVAESDCTFIRNGKRYAAGKAADHLRLKYRRGRKYADTPEHFIERLASKSSMSGKLYYMQCDDDEPIETRRWLEQALRSLRSD